MDVKNIKKKEKVCHFLHKNKLLQKILWLNADYRGPKYFNIMPLHNKK
jgi:hypothetical protein